MNAAVGALTSVLLCFSFSVSGAGNVKGRTSDLTAEQQSLSAADTEKTQRIRQLIMRQEGLSTYAQNVKVITIDGKVTLKGPVRSEAERDSLLQVARNVAGSANVNDELRVVSENTF